MPMILSRTKNEGTSHVNRGNKRYGKIDLRSCLLGPFHSYVFQMAWDRSFSHITTPPNPNGLVYT